MPNKNDEIKVNEIAYVKITWEPIFVLELYPDANRVVVRRGVMSKYGSHYETTEFTIPELTSTDPKLSQPSQFEQLFNTAEGEISVVPLSDPDDDSLLQN